MTHRPSVNRRLQPTQRSKRNFGSIRPTVTSSECRRSCRSLIHGHVDVLRSSQDRSDLRGMLQTCASQVQMDCTAEVHMAESHFEGQSSHLPHGRRALPLVADCTQCLRLKIIQMDHLLPLVTSIATTECELSWPGQWTQHTLPNSLCRVVQNCLFSAPGLITPGYVTCKVPRPPPFSGYTMKASAGTLTTREFGGTMIPF